ncbi:15908_t:CDS:1 [Funneliformis geosporum]|uniref:868_t:CDS:1 n=1 Tax=Funneliformis geosporum TaxID=1117311 RepID=A0A9W4SQ57_9GLOM|nr:15908_t:CDS:1 [Funneliformis geosporum]CAI2176505.1 868_t:CDS:1 [Funneliformis geosporum]
MKSLFLTGSPRVGKTTIISKVIKYLQTTYPETILLHGFYTSEVTTGLNKNNSRIGFDIITIDGKRGVLSRKKDYWTGEPPNAIAPKVGEYIVDLKEFEKIAIPAITIKIGGDDKESKCKKQVVIIDEVGKMESFSNGFNEIVRNLISKGKKNENDICVVGTVALKHGGLAEEIRNKADAGLRRKQKSIDVEEENLVIWEVTNENRERMVNKVVIELEEMLNIRKE